MTVIATKAMNGDSDTTPHIHVAHSGNPMTQDHHGMNTHTMISVSKPMEYKEIYINICDILPAINGGASSGW